MKIELLLLDPTNNDAYENLARKVLKHKKGYSVNETDRHVHYLKMKLFAFLITLLQAKDDHTFQITFYSDMPTIRYELIDNNLILSFLVDQKLEFPLTLVYEDNSYFYKQMRIDFIELQEDASVKRVPWTSREISLAKIQALATEAKIELNIDEINQYNIDMDKQYQEYLAE